MQGAFPTGILDTWQLILAWFAHHEALLIFCAVLLEESGIPVPLPADLAMALAGYRVAQGRMSFLTAFLIGQTATLIGSSILYWAGRRGGRPLLFRYGKLLHLSPHRLAQAERLVTRMGALTVIVGRQIPGLRLAAPLSCGVFRVRYRVFVPAMIVGSSLYIGVFILIGMYGGQAVITTLRAREVPLRLVISTVLLVASAALLHQLGRLVRDVPAPARRAPGAPRRAVEAALLAGLGASALTTLLLTWALDAIGLAGRATPERALARLLQSGLALPAAAVRLSPFRLVFAGLLATLPFQVLAFLLWAIVYALWFEPRLRGAASLRGMRFAALPWLFTMAGLYPALGLGIFGSDAGPRAAAIAATGELLRHAVFGAVLGSLYRLIHLARQPRLHKGHRHGHRHTAMPSADFEAQPKPKEPLAAG